MYFFQSAQSTLVCHHSHCNECTHSLMRRMVILGKVICGKVTKSVEYEDPLESSFCRLMYVSFIFFIECALFDHYEAKLVCRTKFKQKPIHRQKEQFRLDSYVQRYEAWPTCKSLKSPINMQDTTQSQTVS